MARPMIRPRVFRFTATAAASALSLFLLGCEQETGEKVQTWTPADHDNKSTPAEGQVDTPARRREMPELEQYGINDVILATWKQNCVRCHGVIGRGDGPQGRMLKPPDLTNPIWQKNAIDSEIARSIKKGRGQMPPFGHLPDETVEGLVKLVRLLNRDRAAQPTPAEIDENAADEARELPDPPAPARGKSEHGAVTEPSSEPDVSAKQ